MSMRLYVTDSEVKSFRSSAPPVIQIAIDLVLLTRQSLDCLLRLSWREIDVVHRKIVFLTGIRVKGRTYIPITKELEDVLVVSRRLPPSLPRLYILRLEDGMPLKKNEFGNIWRIYMRRWVARNAKHKPFTFEDLRLKAVADKQTEQTTSRKRGH